MAKTRIFLDTTLPLNDSEQLSQVSDQALDKSDVKIQRKCPKTWFFAKNGQKWLKLVIFGQISKTRVISKIPLEHLLDSSRCSFVQKIIKIWCADLQISRRERTDARTHERESIGPSANAERPKNEFSNIKLLKMQILRQI